MILGREMLFLWKHDVRANSVRLLSLPVRVICGVFYKYRVYIYALIL